MISKTNLLLEEKGKKSIVYDVNYRQTKTPKPIVVFCHGYKGFKDWGAWSLVAKTFSEAGFFFLKFNFSHNGGTVDQPIDFPDLEAFSQNNFSNEIDDLERILEYIKTTNEFAGEINANHISLIGHSRGGGIVLIKAEEDPAIKNVITWAGVSDFKVRFQENSENFKSWKKTGITYVLNGRTQQNMPHKFQFYTDFIANEKRFTISKSVQRLSIPYLIVHGTSDPTVTLKEAQLLHQWNSKSTLEIIENGDHVFGASHPWENPELPNDLEKAVKNTIDFIAR